MKTADTVLKTASETQRLLSEKKRLIGSFLEEYLHRQARDVSRFPTDKPAYLALSRLTVAGKMIRGAIIMLLTELFDPDIPDDTALTAAAALELMETGLLIQDDIMDRDPHRRGQDSIHMQFARLPLSLPDDIKSRFGEGAAICLGDAAFFLAYQLLADLPAEEKTLRALLKLYSHQMTLVGAAQTEDLRLSFTGANVSDTEILAMYAGKTATYSFIIPLLTALELSGKRQEYGVSFEKIGEAAGIIFQLTDDRIGLFGDGKQTGKSVGSDIREGKKTLYWFFALQQLAGQDRQTFLKFFGNAGITDHDIGLVSKLVEKSGAGDRVEEIIVQYRDSIFRNIAGLPVSASIRNTLEDLIGFICLRDR